VPGEALRKPSIPGLRPLQHDMQRHIVEHGATRIVDISAPRLNPEFARELAGDRRNGRAVLRQPFVEATHGQVGIAREKRIGHPAIAGHKLEFAVDSPLPARAVHRDGEHDRHLFAGNEYARHQRFIIAGQDVIERTVGQGNVQPNGLGTGRSHGAQEIPEMTVPKRHRLAETTQIGLVDAHYHDLPLDRLRKEGSKYAKLPIQQPGI
jgi:hypothetical protein